MATRTKLRKARREAERALVKEEVRARYLQETARMRKTFAIIGATLAGLVIVIGLVFGVIGIVKKMNPIVTGPFGSVKLKDIKANKFALLETNKGNIKIELTPDATPQTVANFVSLARKNFYEGVTFHRVMKDFMIQTGDPNSKDEDPSNDGQGDPGYKFDDEKFEGEYTRGTVAMANAGSDTNGSQFFIVHQDAQLPKSYVIFGHVVEGIETVDAIANTPVGPSASNPEEKSRPVEPIVINKVIITDK
jgi:cyclophilin family peptidyl-prolyl cis-trans isomerase